MHGGYIVRPPIRLGCPVLRGQLGICAFVYNSSAFVLIECRILIENNGTY